MRIQEVCMKNNARVTVDFNYMMEKSLGDKGIKDFSRARNADIA